MCFLYSFVHPAHERAVKRILAEDLGPWRSLTGNFEGTVLAGGVLRSCADPRRNGAAEGF